jgi:hypothetical protein
MAIFKGNTELSELYVGANVVKEVYKGSDLIWSGDVQRSDPFWNDTIGFWTHDRYPTPQFTPNWENQKLIPTSVDLTATNGNNSNPANNMGGVQIASYWGTALGKTSNQLPAAYGAVLQCDSFLSLGASNFTIEFWTYQYTIITNPVGVVSTLFDATNNGNNVAGLWGMSSTSSQGTAKVGGQTCSSQANSIQTGQWQHHAICRVGTTVTYYVDGVAGSSTASVSGNMGGTYKPCLGALGKTTDREYSCNAVFRQVRLTKAARYTSNFTPFKYFYPSEPI